MHDSHVKRYKEYHKATAEECLALGRDRESVLAFLYHLKRSI